MSGHVEPLQIIGYSEMSTEAFCRHCATLLFWFCVQTRQVLKKKCI